MWLTSHQWLPLMAALCARRAESNVASIISHWGVFTGYLKYNVNVNNSEYWKQTWFASNRTSLLWQNISIILFVWTSGQLKFLWGSVTPQQRCLIWVAGPATWYHITVAGFVCDSCQPCSQIQGSHHIQPDCSGWALTCQKTPTISIHVASISPQGGNGCGGRGCRDGPSCGVLRLMALSTDGSPSSSSEWVCDYVCTQATFQQCVLQSQMDLKMGVCTRGPAAQRLVSVINYVM